MRGQEGSRAAAVIGILTLLFVFYILFLPPETRQELLEGNITDEDDGETQDYDEILLEESIGTLIPEGDHRFDHSIPNLYLAETRESTILARQNPFTIHKGLFGEEQKEFTFTLRELENTENVILSFQALKREGTLNIALNGVTIFQSPIGLQNPPPVNLPNNLLGEINTLKFWVSGGLFEGKEYSLADVKVIGDITDLRKQESTNTFQIVRAELDHLDNSYMDFYPICEQAYTGILTITLNGKAVYSAVPACESVNRQELYAEDLRLGKNTLTFQLSRGQARIEQIRVRNIVEEMKSYVAFFEVEEDLYTDMLQDDVETVLYIDFVSKDRKRAELNINGRMRSIDQKEDRYEREITDYLVEGNNYIELTPITDMNIPRLEVRVE